MTFSFTWYCIERLQRRQQFYWPLWIICAI